MDNCYAGFEQAMLRAATSHNPHESILRSTGGNMQLHSGLYDAVVRIKCEEVASGLSGIFSRAAAQLHDRALKLPELSFNSATSCDLRAIRAPVPSSPPIFDATDFLASSSSFNFLGASEYIPPLHSSVSSIDDTAERSVKQDREAEEFDLASHTVPSSSFPGSMPHASDLFQAVLATLPSNGVHSSTLAAHRSPTEAISSTSLSYPIIPSDAEMPGSVSDSTNSPSKQDSPVQSAEDSDADLRFQSHNSKRRKTQQKRVVCVPIGESKQKGEAPPSDLWAWRKYGQKPIKGSPYPRGYYRCSSSKGCSARKQVERSRSDPNILVVTYTSDHNHPWPANRSSSASANRRPQGCTRGQQEAASSDIAENLFSSIINSPNAVDEQVVSSLDALHDEESFSLQRDVDLCLSKTSTDEDDVFDDLGELPELSAIFSKGFVEERSSDDGLNSMGSCNSGSVSSWSCAALV